MDRTEIRDHFQRHVSAARIDAALELLLSLKRVRRENQPTAGRPREVWYAL
jgi:hypothetical protein